MLNVTAVVAACENAIGSNAYRPGDIIGSMNGKTIEITNTDAEGRLTLADALTYIIRKENVDEVIDAATLTGAIMVALGDNVTGVFSNSDENYKKLEAAGKYWGEKYWQMPIFEEYRDIIKSDVADLKNNPSFNMEEDSRQNPFTEREWISPLIFSQPVTRNKLFFL